MQNPANNIQKVLDIAEERNLLNFTLGYFDHSGRLRAKYYNTASLEKSMTDGVALNLGVLAATANETPMESSIFLDPANQFRDAQMRLMADTCRDFPLDGQNSSLLLLGEIVDEFRAYCPRAMLTEELLRWEELGMRPYGAFEFECYLLEETRESIQDKVPNSLSVHSGFEWFYSFTDQIEQNDLFREILETCHAMDMPIETAHTEFTRLFECALRPAFGQSIADNAGLFKWVVKAIAQRRGLMASFMARRNNVDQGCGAHINLSLVDAEDNPAFYDADAPDRLSDTLRHFVAGLQRYTPELFLLHAPNLNSYRRYEPGLFTPLSNLWGINNKTVAFRAVNVSPGSTRIESRLPGADVNPYLALTSMLIAGRKGIEESLDAQDPTDGDGWSLASPEGMSFPLTFTDAIDSFGQSALAREALGEAFVDCYVTSRQHQIEELAATITDWEVRAFVEGA